MKKKYDLSVIDNQYGEQICQEYLAGEYAYILAETYLGNKKDIRYIYSVLERHNIPKRTKKELALQREEKGDNPNSFKAKYKQNDNYFQKWSYNMAYLLGYIATDGCVVGNNILKFGLAEKDSDLLDKIKLELSVTGPILNKTIHLESTGKEYQVKEMTIRSKQIVSDLRNLGIDNNKTFTIGNFNFIPPKYQKAFLLGVVDGDGGYDRILGSKCEKSVQLRVRLCSASYDFIQSFRDLMVNNGFSKVGIKKEKRENPFYTVEYSTKDAINFISCYENVTVYLNRKIEKLVDLISQRKEYEKTAKGLKIHVSDQIQEYNITKSPQHLVSYKVEKVRQTESELTD